MSDRNDAVYFSRRATEEAAKAKAAKMRGDDPSVAAVHNELAVRYQARCNVLRRLH